MARRSKKHQTLEGGKHESVYLLKKASFEGLDGT